MARTRKEADKLRADQRARALSPERVADLKKRQNAAATRRKMKENWDSPKVKKLRNQRDTAIKIAEVGGAAAAAKSLGSAIVKKTASRVTRKVGTSAAGTAVKASTTRAAARKATKTAANTRRTAKASETLSPKASRLNKSTKASTGPKTRSSTSRRMDSASDRDNYGNRQLENARKAREKGGARRRLLE